MKPHTDLYTDALAGSVTPIVRVDAWRGGRLVEWADPITGEPQGLPVTGGQLTISGGQAIRSKLTATITDTDGSLAPRTQTDALAPFGSELHLRMGLVTGQVPELFSMGWFPIQSSATVEQHQRYVRPHELGRTYFLPRGQSTTVEATDRAQYIADFGFIAREQPPPGATVLTEIARLLQGVVPYAGTTGAVADKPVPVGITYDDDRSKALQELAAAVDCEVVLNGDGAAAVQATAPGPAAWVIGDGDGGTRISMTRSMTRSGVRNAVVFRGTAPDQRVLQAVVPILTGPLVWGGPFGRAPLFRSSPLMTTQAMVDAAAITSAARLSATAPVVIDVRCTFNPALEVGDTVRLPLPNGAVDGPVTEAVWPLLPGPMSLKVAVDPIELAAAA